MTSGRGDEDYLAAGGPARHVPVLRDEVMAALAPARGRTLSRRHIRRRRLFARLCSPSPAPVFSRSIATLPQLPAEPGSWPKRRGGFVL